LRRLELLTFQADAQILNGQPAKAEETYSQVMNDLRRLGRDRGTLASGLGIRRLDAAISSGDLHKALSLIDDAIAIARQDLPDRAPPVLLLYERSLVLSDLGKYSDALAGFEVVTHIAPAEDRRVTHSSLLAGSVALSRMGQFSEAENHYRRAVEFERNDRGELGPADKLTRMLARAKLDLDRREYEAARQMLNQALQVDGAAVLAVASTHYFRSLANLGLGDVNDAATDAQVALQMSEKLRGDKPYSAWVGLASSAVAQVASARKDTATAQTSYAMAVEQLGHSVDEGHPVLMEVRMRLRQLQGSER
jgi:tetratricopeptide (TPR) repeat protein